jgi:hypothetical protein
MQQISLENGLLISLSDISPSPVEFVICLRWQLMLHMIQYSLASIQWSVESVKREVESSAFFQGRNCRQAGADKIY